MKRLLVCLVACLALLVPTGLAAAANTAASTTDKGLLISPLRAYVSLDAGERKSGVMTIANLTNQTLTISLTVKQFSVVDYSYNYDFRTANSWVSFSEPELTLPPGGSKSVTYFMNIPKGTPAGGQYYTLLASATIGNGSLTSTIQAASLIYITVNGSLVRTSQLVDSSIPRIVFGKQLEYTLDVRNTGNVHYFAYYSGQLHGPTTSNATGTSHILLPDSIRRVTGDIKTPLLPGVYKATYGYKTDAGAIVQRSKLIVFLPPWSLAVVGVLMLIGMNFCGRKRKRAQSDDTNSEELN